MPGKEAKVVEAPRCKRGEVGSIPTLLILVLIFYGFVAKLAAALDSKFSFCGFNSHQSHREIGRSFFYL